MTDQVIQATQVEEQKTTADKIIGERADKIIGERYEVIKSLGKGSTCKVYKAMDTQENKYVAIKVVNMDFFKIAKFKGIKLMRVGEDETAIQTDAESAQIL